MSKLGNETVSKFGSESFYLDIIPYHIIKSIS